MPSKDEILKLEREFWTTMAAGEHTASAKLLAGQAAMVSGKGALTFSPDEYVAMGEKSPFKITDWSMSDEDVIFPTPETAVCTYKVKQTIENGGKSDTTINVDASVWAKEGGAWKCIMHTETPSSQ